MSVVAFDWKLSIKIGNFSNVHRNEFFFVLVLRMGLAQLLVILKTQKLDFCTGLAELMFFDPSWI